MPVLQLPSAAYEPATREKLHRSSLIAAQLLGLAFMRFAWKIEPQASMDDDDIVAAIAPTIQRYLDGGIHPAA